MVYIKQKQTTTKDFFMKYLFLEYPKCSTCQKAKQWLLNNGFEFEDRHIVNNPPTREEFNKWIECSNRTPRSFFNTCGLQYKTLNLKEKLPNMSISEQIDLLTSDGMLIKRPLLIGNNIVLSGFRPEIWDQLKA